MQALSELLDDLTQLLRILLDKPSRLIQMGRRGLGVGRFPVGANDLRRLHPLMLDWEKPSAVDPDQRTNVRTGSRHLGGVGT